MKKVLIATEKPFAKAAIESIRKIITDAGFELQLLEKYTSNDDLKKAISEVNAVIIRSDIVDKKVLEAAKNLEIVVRAGAGFDNIDLKAASAKGVVAMNTPGQNANAVAELVFGLLIYLIRHQYDGSTGSELRKKTLGIHGYGFIGKIVAQIAKGFGMKVCAYDPYINHAAAEKDGLVCECDIKDFYKKCQYVTLHIPANDETKKMINFDLLSLMPEGATLVNTSRKEIIDEDGLMKMFETRKDFLYASDIASDNQVALNDKYKGRFYFTSKKTGAQTHEANNNAGLAAANQIVNFLVKGDKTYQVNK